jgi:hypothetical protein
LKTGDTKKGRKYFKSLGDIILEYIRHPERKYEGDIGFLKRRFIQADKIIHVGKEVNSLEEDILELKGEQIFVNKNEILQKILSIRQSQAEKYGVRRGTFWKIKKKIQNTGDINLKTRAVKRLLRIIGE